MTPDAESWSTRLSEMTGTGEVRSVHRPPSSRTGLDLINLSSGDPTIPTPPEAVRAAQIRLGQGNLTYTDPHGAPALRAAIRHKFEVENGLRYSDEEIAVSSGSKQVMVNALLATVDTGDEVILLAPYFAPYPRMVALAGGIPKIVQTAYENDFKATADEIADSVTERTKWVVVNNPSNPTGVVYSASELSELCNAALAVNPQVRFMSDEVYEHFTFGGNRRCSTASLSQEIAERTLTVNSVSKTYSMTGWRLGYAGGAANLIAAMRTIQHATSTSPSEVSQVAAIAALDLPLDVLDRRRDEAERRLSIALDELATIPELAFRSPAGSIYIYVNCKSVLDQSSRTHGVATDSQLSEFLRHEFGVLALPGSSYGASPFLRLTFVIDEPELIGGLGRLRAGIRALTSGNAG